MRNFKFVFASVWLIGCGASEVGNYLPPTWTEPQRIGIARATDQAIVGGSEYIDRSLGSIGVDQSGNSVIVFRKIRENQNRYNVLTNRFTAEGGWGEPVAIDSDVGFPLYNTSNVGPLMAMHRDGRAIAIWMSGIESSCPPCSDSIFTSDFSPAQGWSAPTNQFDNIGGSSNVSAITFGSDDSAFGIWAKFNAGWDDQFVNRFRPGVGWEPYEALSAKPSFSNASMDSNSAGDAIAVWIEKQSDNVFQVVARRYVSGQGWEASPNSISDNLESGADVEIKMDMEGNAIAVWAPLFSTGPHNVYVNRYVKDTGWTGPTILKEQMEGYPLTPSLCMNDSGKAYVVWTASQTEMNRLRLFSFDSALGWSEVEVPEVATPDVDVSEVKGAKCALDNLGVLTIADIVWTKQSETDPFQSQIWAQQQFQGIWATPVPLGTKEPLYDQNIQMAVNSSGKRFVAWEHVGVGGSSGNYITIWSAHQP